MADRVRMTGPVAVGGASALWGTTGAAVSFAPSAVPSTALASAGLVLGGALLFATKGSRGGEFRDRDWLRIAVAVVGVVGFRLAFYGAIERVGMALTTVVALGTVPVFVGLASWLVLRTPPSTRWAAGSATAVAGCSLLLLGESAAETHLPGLALALAAGACCALYSLASWSVVDRGRCPRRVMGVVFGLAALLASPMALADGGALFADARGPAVVLYLALVPTLLAYHWFGQGLRTTPPLLVGTLALVEPAVAAVLGIVVLGERLSPRGWLGLLVLVIALVFLTIPRGATRS